ncbi:MAG: PH domain-containing protein [Phycisphaerales bacterium]|nr:PH domain-containing protein [Phycisphaerales bacterium]
MSAPADSAAAWVYSGVWAGLVRWLRVPPEPPTLPVRAGQPLESFRPGPGFLAYLKFWFWIALLAIDVLILFGWIVILTVDWRVAMWLLVPTLIVAILPDIVAYVAMHLRYDATWYVMTDRSLRIRTGIVSIRETTITFENVQNVKVEQGPVQRRFGIATVVVETAGGGSGGAPGKGGSTRPLNQGRLEGLANAEAIRDLIMSKVRASTSAGLGDERPGAEQSRKPRPALGPAHLEALRAMRDEARALRAAATR